MALRIVSFASVAAPSPVRGLGPGVLVAGRLGRVLGEVCHMHICDRVEARAQGDARQGGLQGGAVGHDLLIELLGPRVTR